MPSEFFDFLLIPTPKKNCNKGNAMKLCLKNHRLSKYLYLFFFFQVGKVWIFWKGKLGIEISTPLPEWVATPIDLEVHTGCGSWGCGVRLGWYGSKDGGILFVQLAVLCLPFLLWISMHPRCCCCCSRYQPREKPFSRDKIYSSSFSSTHLSFLIYGRNLHWFLGQIVEEDLKDIQGPLLGKISLILSCFHSFIT